MALKDYWPQFASHELRKGSFQAERYYVQDLTPIVTFATRGIWRATFDFGSMNPARAESLAGEIASIEDGGVWPLFLPGIYMNVPYLNSTMGTLTATISADGTFTFPTMPDSGMNHGRVVQVGRYVLRVKSRNGRMVKFENVPREIMEMTVPERNALKVRFSVPNDDPLTIRARMVGGNVPAVEILSSAVTRVLPIEIVEVAGEVSSIVVIPHVPGGGVIVATELPAKPTGVNLTPTANRGELTLAWTNPTNNTITSWQYSRRVGNTGDWGEWIEIPASNAVTTSYLLGSLADSTTYNARVRAVNSLGAGPASDAASGTTIAFTGAVTNLPKVGANGRIFADASDNTILKATWDNPNDATITSYSYEYSSVARGETNPAVTVSGSNASTVSITMDIPTVEAYSVSVYAHNSIGRSLVVIDPNITPGTTLLPAPYGLTVGIINPGDTLNRQASWAILATDENYWQWRYRLNAQAEWSDWIRISPVTLSTPSQIHSRNYRFQFSGHRDYQVRAVGSGGFSLPSNIYSDRS